MFYNTTAFKSVDALEQCYVSRSSMILEDPGSKPGWGGCLKVYSFLVWKNSFVQEKINEIFCSNF